MAASLDTLSSYYIEDKPIVMEELGHGAFAVVKKVGRTLLSHGRMTVHVIV